MLLLEVGWSCCHAVAVTECSWEGSQAFVSAGCMTGGESWVCSCCERPLGEFLISGYWAETGPAITEREFIEIYNYI